MRLSYKIGSALATSALLGSLLAPAAFAQSNVVVSTNGVSSTNSVTLDSTCVSTVDQTNTATINATVNSNANTGNNQANLNTGGGVSVTSGAANSSANLSVTGSSNTATAPSCCGCSTGLGDVTVDRNGVNSNNTVNTTNTAVTAATQANKLRLTATVRSRARTGHNTANLNTGTGLKTVTSGGAISGAGLSVSGSSNTLTP